MGNRQSAEARKTALLRRMLELTHQEVLLVDLDGLTGLLEEKERLIEALRAVDLELEAAAPDQTEENERKEQARLLEILLENETAIAERVGNEPERLRSELRELERETRLRKYLERPAARRARVDLKQ